MKTIEDLQNLFPTIAELFATEDHNIGESYVDENGISSDYEENTFTYEEDGWLIEISYLCTGEWDRVSGGYWNPADRDLLRGWGEVTEIYASHYDEESDEDTEFSAENLTDLKTQINEILKELA